MVGYVVADKPELKMKEYELYSSYYCGVCKSIGRRHGQFPRLVLSYDSAFLAAVLSSLFSGDEEIERQHCIVHPVKRKNICVNNEAVDYAADVMIILAYQKLKDDIKDDKKATAMAMELVFRSTYRKLEREYPDLCRVIERELEQLTAMEREKCDSLDRSSDSFAHIMEAAFGEFFKKHEDLIAEREILKIIGFHLGKWMYVIDAYDDIGENIKDGNYNPLIYRYQFDSEKEDEESFRTRIRDKAEFLLFHYLGEMGKAYDLLELKKNKGLVENIIFMGLFRKTEQVLAI